MSFGIQYVEWIISSLESRYFYRVLVRVSFYGNINVANALKMATCMHKYHNTSLYTHSLNFILLNSIEIKQKL